ncbi:hypothetical protein F2Q68_00015421 [Brassica cretica]|uniref:Uncharacterized protein n=1 Tax=Brassica cretica TaxID=69181 RepID=A0A8S9HCW1_BRACR|nr:hypothetical protein F2Q68_00015421 [Brassica cretica]
MIAAQLRLTGGEGPSMTVPRVDEVPPSSTKGARKGKKRKRAGSSTGVERSAEETSDVPPSGELQKKKKTNRRSIGEQSENVDEPTEHEGEVQEEELQPEEEASEAEVSEERNDEERASEGEEFETSLNAARPDDSEEESEGSPLLIRRRDDEAGSEARSPAPTFPRERSPVPIKEGAVQIDGQGEYSDQPDPCDGSEPRVIQK